MPKSNIKLLTKDERQYFRDNYNFELQGNFVLVKFKNYGRVVAHSIFEPFSIVSKIRKITISVNAIDLWKDKFMNSKYTLIDVQNAINALTIGYQATDYDEVNAQLNAIDEIDMKAFQEDIE